ncbi:MAG: YjbQ family protein [Planctomycetes bacterium]|nr:YjbQ family protein [Planctomycetota bacterium]
MLHASTVFTLDTSAPFEVVDVTDRVSASLARLGVRAGLASVMTRHTTAAIRLGEAETGLFQDFEAFLGRLAPPGQGYRHDSRPVDDRKNAHSHLAAFLLGASESFPLREGKPALGTWQRILFVELDGPRRGREVVVTVVGE